MKYQDLKAQLALAQKANEDLQAKNKLLHEKYDKAVMAFPDIVESFGFDGGSLVQWNSPEYMREILESDTKLDETVLSVKKSIREFGEYMASSKVYTIAEKLYKHHGSSARTKHLVLCLLSENGFSDQDVIQFCKNNMTDNFERKVLRETPHDF